MSPPHLSGAVCRAGSDDTSTADLMRKFKLNYILRVVSAVAILNLSLSNPSWSGTTNLQQRMLDASYKTKHDVQDSDFGKQRSELIAWLQQLEHRLKDQAEFDKLTAEYAGDKSARDSMTCYCKVNAKGEILNPTMHFTSDSASLDRKLINLVVKAGPLEPPINKLPETRGVRITLVRFEVGGEKRVSLVRDICPEE